MPNRLIPLVACAALACPAGVTVAQDKPVASEAAAQPFALNRLKLPEGFRAEIWASGLPGARAMTLGASGKKVYVGTRIVGRVYEVTDLGDRRAVRVVAEHLAQPASLAFGDGDLYVFAADKVLRFDEIETNPRARPVDISTRFDSTPEHPHPALTLAGYTGNMFPPEYRNSIFVARPGNWDGGKLLGFDIVSIRAGTDCNQPTAKPFLTGFVDSKANKFWGIPAQVLQAPDGALLVPDEQLGVIYRISYSAPAKK